MSQNGLSSFQGEPWPQPPPPLARPGLTATVVSHASCKRRGLDTRNHTPCFSDRTDKSAAASKACLHAPTELRLASDRAVSVGAGAVSVAAPGVNVAAGTVPEGAKPSGNGNASEGWVTYFPGRFGRLLVDFFFPLNTNPACG